MKSVMRLFVGGCAALLFGGAVHAQDQITYRWVVSDTGNGDGLIEPGESAVLTLVGDMVPQRTGFGATYFDVRGGSNWDTGDIVSYDNLLDALTDNGELIGNDIFGVEPFQLPIIFNENFDGSNPIPLFQVVWQPHDYSARTVNLTSSGHDWNDVYTDEFGSNVPYTPIIQPGSFDITSQLFCAISWAQQSSGGPTPRLGGAMAYDSDRHVVVLFGGQTDAGSNGETWEWDGFSWKQVSTTGPSRRSQARMAYDQSIGACVLFGGIFAGQRYNDTWLWDGTQWTQANVPGPTARDQHSMVYDDARDRVVLFGGFDGAFYLDDTWEWDGDSWSKSPQFGPSGRRSPVMTFDPVRRVSVLFGGANAGQRFGDTWAWDGVAWKQLATTGPAARESTGFAWDTLRGVGVLFGGSSAGHLFDDTWEWDGSHWQLASQGDLARWDHMMAYDPIQGGTVCFGGWDGAKRSNETWTWRGTSGPLVTSQPLDSFAAPGDTASFSVGVSGGGPFEYQWRRNGLPLADGATGTGSEIVGSDTSELDILGVGEEDEGYYDCVVANVCDQTVSGLARLQVSDACGGDSSTIFAGNDTTEGDTFGQSVSLYGGRLLVGAFRDVTGGIDSGSAYVFDRDQGGAWTQTTKLLGPGRTFNDEFGWSVSLMDGRAVVGANRPGEKGTVYVFHEQSGAWPLEQQLLAPDGQTDDTFGQAVAALSTSAGDFLAVGANRHDDFNVDSGSAYVFKRNGAAWSLMQKILPSSGNLQDQFGRSVALLETGSGVFLAIGCQAADIAGTDTGAMYIYRLAGGTWTLEATLVAPDPSRNQWFGRKVSLAGFSGGEVCVIGAEQDDQLGADAGAAYVFRRVGGVWTFKAKLTAADTIAGDRFGSSIAVTTSERGDTIVVGATGDVEGGFSSGSAYFFENRDGAWLEVRKVLPVSPNDGEEFGYSVAAQNFDLGPVLAVGARLDDERGPYSGSVAVYEFPLGAPTFAVQPNDQQIPVGDPVEFAATVMGSGPFTFQWSFNGVPLEDDARISGSHTETLRIDPVQMDDEGAYRLSANGACGEASSLPAILTPICRPDMNGDGKINTLDVITYLGFWALKDPAADWNGDGVVNTIDFIQFLNAWVAGC